MEFRSLDRILEKSLEIQKTPEIILDCCVLSNFALSGSLAIIKSLYENAASITDFVSAEIMRGIQKGHADLEKNQEALRDGWLKETTLESKEEKDLFRSISVPLGLGEASSIAVAKVRGFVFACDDRTARREAQLMRIKLTGTLGILNKAVRMKVITLKNGDLILKRMTEHGFHSPVRSLKEIF